MTQQLTIAATPQAVATPEAEPMSPEHFEQALRDKGGCYHIHHPNDQDRALDILQFKLDMLWRMLDAMTMAMAYELKRPPYHTVATQRVYHRGLL